MNRYQVSIGEIRIVCLDKVSYQIDRGQTKGFFVGITDERKV